MQNQFVIAALLGTAAALPLTTTAFNANLKCSPCVQAGNIWCSKTANFGPYKLIAAGGAYPTFNTDQTAEYQCCQNAACGTQFDTSGSKPNKADFTCTSTDFNTAIASCPFMVDKCSATQTYTKALGDAEDTINMTQVAVTDQSCTYKIVATSGAPGFNFQTDQNASTKNFLVSWYEYDLDSISAFAAGSTWPAIDTSASEVDCGSNCVQGELIARTKTVNNVVQNVNAYSILQQLQAARSAYNEYTIRATAVLTFNGSLITPSIFDVLFFNKKGAEAQVMPERPAAYSGDTFVGTGATGNQGGYGKVTTGMLSIPTTNTLAGYKPYGALGQGPATNLNVALDTAAKQRVMLVTVYSKDAYSTTNFNNVLKVGAYAWGNIDFSTPQVPPVPTISAGAQYLSMVAVTAASLAALTLY